MLDPILGELVEDHEVGGCLVGSIPFQDRDVGLRIDPDGQELPASLDLARQLVVSLTDLETRARSAATQVLLDSYNSSWRSYQRTRLDGSMEEVVDPVLTPQAFAHHLRLEWLAVTGDLLEFGFGAERLFAGHSVVVHSFDGLLLDDVDASIFG
jgi:hypothetical protein